MKKVISLQGGGCLGYGQAVTLASLESGGAPLWSRFDLVAGTSVGSINAACIAAGLPMSDLPSFFTADAPKIFDGSFWNTLSMLWSAKYSPAALESALQARLGDKTLADCKTHFLATAYDVATDRPVYFKSYEASRSDKNEVIVGPDSGVKLWQVCRASSAAQSYFPAYVWNGMTLLDGGNTGDNAPDALALAEFCEHFGAPDTIRMLSLGAGDSKWTVTGCSLQNPGILRVALATIQIVFSAGESNSISIARSILGDRHVRLSADLGNGYSIDDASADTLAAIQAAWRQSMASNQVALQGW